MRSSRFTALAAAAAALATLLGHGGALARVEATLQYTKAQTYSGALRFLRVDQGYKVDEKDPDAAYILFEYHALGQDKSVCTGSVEIVEADGEVRLFVQIPKMPEYHERVLRDGLLRKLHDEYGTPPPRRPDTGKAPPSQPAPDAGTH